MYTFVYIGVFYIEFGGVGIIVYLCGEQKQLAMDNTTFEGRNGTWTVTDNGNIRIKLNFEGGAEAPEYKDKTDGDFLWDMFEDIFCNSAFELLTPEDVGALTDSVILGWDIPRNNEGEIREFDDDCKVWWFPNYMVRSIHDELRDNAGYAYLTYAS